ncbi:MAG TPA: ABC transporter permease, partial [Thermoanaerobaculia bacterium]|nr:ABC transporter permease [Thermoanaerobaculia bacterium]
MDRFQDLRFSLRALAKSPGFSLVAVACLAIGVGATTAIFSLANGLFLRPLPGLAEPGRLVDVAGLGSYADFRDLRDSASAAGSLSGVAAFLDRQVSVDLPGAAGAGAEAQAVIGQLVTGEYFEVLGTGPQRGRLLGRADEDEGAPVAVIGDRLWRDRFGADPGVVGRVLRLNGVPFTVVGVAPEGFIGTFVGLRFDVWVPITTVRAIAADFELEERSIDRLEVVGRLAAGAGAEAQAVIGQLVTGEYFEVLGTGPQRGRLLGRAD